MRLRTTLVTLGVAGLTSLALTATTAAPANADGVVGLTQATYSNLVAEDTTVQAKAPDLVETDTKGDSSPIVDNEDAQDADSVMTADLAPKTATYTFDSGVDTTADDDDVEAADDTALAAVYKAGFMQGNPIADADFADGWPCIPGNMWYCYRTNGGRTNAVAAMNYSHSHTSRTSRYFVPFSSMSGGASLRNRKHYIYVIYFRMSNGSKRTFKYGITSMNPYTKRTNRQLSKCNTWTQYNYTGYIKYNSCAAKWIAVTSDNDGWGKARWMEASLILAYVRKNTLRFCPPGQFTSCR